MKIGTARVETFSDNVLSIIITIMILSIHLPEAKSEHTSWQFRNHLLQLLPYFITYVFSFLMIGIFWINHHHMFHLLEKTDEPLIFQNFLFLFWVSLIPFATASLGANPLLPDTVALYGLFMFLATSTFAYMRAYTLRKGLVHHVANKRLNTSIRMLSLKARTKSIIGTSMYLASIPLAYLSIYISFGCFLVAALIFFIPDGIDDETLAEQIEEKK